MKNLIDPSVLTAFSQQPTPIEEIVKFLDEREDITTTYLCSLINLNPQRVYEWRSRQKMKSKAESQAETVSVNNTSKNQNRYTGEEKLQLIREYMKSNDTKKAELLRRHGLYATDILRWFSQFEEEGIKALSQRKVRKDKKSEEQLKIEKLELELRRQEKTTAKLSSLVLIQKKVLDILEKPE